VAKLRFAAARPTVAETRRSRCKRLIHVIAADPDEAIANIDSASNKRT
jgi:hypothetical protein